MCVQSHYLVDYAATCYAARICLCWFYETTARGTRGSKGLPLMAVRACQLVCGM